MSRRQRVILKAAVWGVCLFPLALLLSQFWTDDLGANPIDHITRTLGVWTLRLLLASLAMTPLRLLFRISWPITLRRLLGLFAFFYICLHFAVWIVVDHFFDWEQLLADIVKRPYITVGFLALVLLVPLAATSTAGMVKRLGAAAWKRLHRLVYVAGVLGVLHFLWLAKKGRIDPFVYAGVLAILLGIRLWDWGRRAAARRRQRGATSPGLGTIARSRLPGGGEQPIPVTADDGQVRRPRSLARVVGIERARPATGLTRPPSQPILGPTAGVSANPTYPRELLILWVHREGRRLPEVV